MPRIPKPPSYRRHKQSGQAIVTLTDPTGLRRDVLLGEHGTAASRSEYLRVIGEWEAAGRRLVRPVASEAALSVNELLLAWDGHAQNHYRHPDGRPTGELVNFKQALRPLRRLYGRTPAIEFGPLSLKAVRAQMVELGWARSTINQHVGRIKHVWKWAASEEIIPATAYEALRTVAGYARGRCPARETEPVQPVPLPDYEAASPHLPAPVRALIEFMRYTGARPGEATRITRRQLDVTGAVWLYAPAQHKNTWRGKSRVIAIGPKAQATLRPWLKPELDAPLFSPRDAKRLQWERARAKRVTKRHACEAKGKNPARLLAKLAEFYSVPRIDKAIERACDKAGVPRWSANQLRHLHATEIRKRFGLEAAQAALGHDRVETTQLYAEKNIELARRIAAEVG